MKMILLVILFATMACGTNTARTLVKPDIQSKNTPFQQTKQKKNSFSIIPYDIDDLQISDLNGKLQVNTKEKTRLLKKQGFRVQIIVLEDFAQAKKIEETLRIELKDTEHIVYNSYSSPNYRIRVGDFKNRDAAKKILPLLHKLGYKDAFPVKDIVSLTN